MRIGILRRWTPLSVQGEVFLKPVELEEAEYLSGNIWGITANWELQSKTPEKLAKRIFSKRNLRNIYTLYMRILRRSIKASYILWDLEEAVFLKRMKWPTVLPSTVKPKKVGQRGENCLTIGKSVLIE